MPAWFTIYFTNALLCLDSGRWQRQLGTQLDETSTSLPTCKPFVYRDLRAAPHVVVSCSNVLASNASLSKQGEAT
jgi:hypothetical protein